MISEALKIEKIRAKSERDRALLQAGLGLLANPITVGLGALAVNRLAYKAGYYKRLPDEKDTSILGGPVWFTIGSSLPMEQERYEKINLFIVTACTAWALGGGVKPLLQSVSGLGAALA